jgi:hypothetical protein
MQARAEHRERQGDHALHMTEEAFNQLKSKTNAGWFSS